MSVKILHAADFHMDSPLDALSETKAAERRREMRDMLLSLAELVNREGVQIVLLSGDLLDSSASYYETHSALADAFKKMHARVFISPGNHDYYSAKSPYAFVEFPENVHIFTTPIITAVEIPELDVRVYGAGFASPLCVPLLDGFTAENDGKINLMTIHGEIGGESYNPITTAQISASGLDYLALGHVHASGGVQWAGSVPYAYPGCIMGRGFDETGEKGVLIGTVSKGECRMDFVPIAGRRYRIMTADLTDETSPLAAVEKQIPPGSENDIYRIIFTGEFDGDIDTDSLTAQLAERFYSVQLRNKTHVRRDIWQGAKEDSLRGIFLQKMLLKYESADENGKKLVADAVRYALAALENREEWRP